MLQINKKKNKQWRVTGLEEGESRYPIKKILGANCTFFLNNSQNKMFVKKMSHNFKKFGGIHAKRICRKQKGANYHTYGRNLTHTKNVNPSSQGRIVVLKSHTRTQNKR
jgi:hypothetical protein